MALTTSDTGIDIMRVDPNELGVTVQLPQRSLACAMCRRRKIKCDKQSPCSNCWKFDLTCEPATPSFARKEKRRVQDLKDRLERCEALLEWYGPSGPSGPPPPSLAGMGSATPGSAAATKPGTPNGASKDDLDSYLDGLTLQAKQTLPNGKLVMEDGNIKFTDREIWSAINENLQAIRSILESDPQDDQYDDTDTLTIDSHDTLMDLEDLVPTPAQIFRLWQIFLERVNPMTKIIHAPTLQHIVVEGTENHNALPIHVQALLFGIYLTATLAMSEDEVRRCLGAPKDEMRRRFTLAVKKSLIKTNFHKNTDMTSLQALVLFLLSLQDRFNRHATWIICGAMVRMAQKLGLHCDGEEMGLPPFETEMRRRLWWQIVLLDAKYAIHSGLGDVNFSRNFDTKLPLNVNDADMYPGSSEPIQSREGPTEMVFCLLFYNIAQYFFTHPQVDFEDVVMGRLETDPTSPDYPRYQAAHARISGCLDEVETMLLELENRYCSPSMGPVHIMAAQLRPLVTGKLRAMITPMRTTPEWGSEVRDASDNLYRICICCEELNLACYAQLGGDGVAAGFYRLHFELDGFFFLVSQTYRRATGSLAERAWVAIDRTYARHDDLWDMSLRNNAELGALVLLAWQARERALSATCLTVPACIPRLMNVVPPGVTGNLSGLHTSDPGNVGIEKTGDPVSRPGHLWEEMGTTFVGLGNLGAGIPE